jgi:hypothetical protein
MGCSQDFEHKGITISEETDEAIEMGSRDESLGDGFSKFSDSCISCTGHHLSKVAGDIS